MENSKTNYKAIYTLSIVFFFWGFIAAGNNIFIPFFKANFHLDQFQSQLIDFSFYTAYYMGAFLIYIYSFYKGKDIILNYGYKYSLIFGLCISFIGSILMIFSLKYLGYVGILASLFIIAIGFAIQQTCATPFIIMLGPKKYSTYRAILGGAVNSLGTTMGPLLIGLILFGSLKVSSESFTLKNIIILYMIISIIFICISYILYSSKTLPIGLLSQPIANCYKPIKIFSLMTIILSFIFSAIFYYYYNPDCLLVFNFDPNFYILFLLILAFITVIICIITFYFKSKNNIGWGAISSPKLIFGMLAIFFYVGVEVSIGSNLPYLIRSTNYIYINNIDITQYVTMYWSGMMIGRWIGSIGIFKKNNNKITIILLGLFTYFFILMINIILGYNINLYYPFIIPLIIQIILFIISIHNIKLNLFLFSIFGLICIILGLSSSGLLSVYCLISSGLACSIMWPSIFTLSIEGLGKYTSQGSSFLIMMILGGGIIPPLQGKVGDIIGAHNSYYIALICFIYLFMFSLLHIWKKKTNY